MPFSRQLLNDRGIDLTLSDMLKNFLFSKAGKRIEEIKNNWSQIVGIIGQENMKAFIRHDWMSKYGQTREKELYKKIKLDVKSNPKAIDYISNLKLSATVYDAIKNPDHEIWSNSGIKCKNLLEHISILGPVQCYPLILSTYFSNKKELLKVLTWIVNLTVRYSTICAKGTGNLETAYARASAIIHKDPSDIKGVKNALLNIWPTDDEFKSAFKEKTLTTPRIIRYILTKIECTLSNDDSLVPNSEVLSVEHILPKSPNKDWPNKMRKDEYIKEYVNKIGNLTILTEPMNRECESNSFLSKKVIYKDSSFSITKKLYEESSWTEIEIENRQSELAEVAVKTWTI